MDVFWSSGGGRSGSVVSRAAPHERKGKWEGGKRRSESWLGFIGADDGAAEKRPKSSEVRGVDAEASDLGSRTSCFGEGRREPRSCFKLRYGLQRKCKSHPNVSRVTSQNCGKISEREMDFHRVKRSLRLLGFDLSDFGISSGGADATFTWKPQQKPPAITTKVADRSISLDSLRAAVMRAWLDDRLDDSHRRLLAQAAYEEWYFTKERQSWQRREEERVARLKANENLREDFRRKKEKSEEEFQKWLRGKRQQKGRRQETGLSREEDRSRVLTAREESEKAFLKWKRAKDKELERRKMEQRKEEEKKVEAEKQKTERKVVAEKAFQQWKSKLEKNERLKEAERQKTQRKQGDEVKRKRAEESKISFQMWKAAKDEEMKEKIKQFREADRMAREERLAQAEERMYEAEQAFEDWLERVDLRRQKQFYCLNACQKNIPWIPV